MRIIRSFLLFIALLPLSLLTYAQDEGNRAEMADTMRSNGRIYVVVAVVVVILLGLILYLVRLDRKISRMEKERK
ncbi:MAG TPA: CcmD family protein [Chitinophagaceae bacterium]|nr:CcmD family protein [Chitinophagaceae bacterium]